MKKINKLHFDRGFSVIETILVVGVILILAGTTLVVLRSSQEKDRDHERKFSLSQVQLALELYANDHDKQYPDHTDKSPKENYQALSQDLVPQYIKSLPQDPLNNDLHKFEYQSKGGKESGYELNASLERRADDGDKNSRDEGNEDGVYEVGTDLAILKSSNH